MRKKRGYTRSIPEKLVRDYKLFAIACEGGKREPLYFSLFEKMSKRIKVDIIEDKEVIRAANEHETKSSPKWVMDRAIKYIEKEGLIDEDDLWFVMDVDKWLPEQLREIAQYCATNPNWHIVLSNPCFEVWLYFHKKEKLLNPTEISCSALKAEVSKLEKGGYNEKKFMPHLFEAINNAKKADTNLDHFLPNQGETKIYQLAEALIQVIGKNDFEKFLAERLQ